MKVEDETTYSTNEMMKLVCLPLSYKNSFKPIFFKTNYPLSSWPITGAQFKIFS